MRDELPAAIGETIGSYELQSVIGRGGMGCVYLASHVVLGRKAAVKVLRSHFAADASYVNRLRREARVVNDVRHPNIVDVIDFIISDSPRRIACVMEYLDGVPLRRLLEKGQRLSLHQTGNLFAQITDAVGAVHALGVVHRDLKPDNLMVLQPIEGEFRKKPAVKILDFGIAKVSDATGQKTAPGAILGTPLYMAPEQIYGDAVSPATDVYALGELLFEMLAGKRLWPGRASDVLRLKTSGVAPEVELPAELDERVRGRLEELIRRSVLVQPDERPPLAELATTVLELASSDSTVVRRVEAARQSPPRGDSPTFPTLPLPAPVPPSAQTLPPAGTGTLITQQVRPSGKMRWVAMAIAGVVAAGVGALVGLGGAEKVEEPAPAPVTAVLPAAAVPPANEAHEPPRVEARAPEPALEPQATEEPEATPEPEAKPTEAKPTEGKPTEGKPTEAKVEPAPVEPKRASPPPAPLRPAKNDAVARGKDLHDKAWRAWTNGDATRAIALLQQCIEAANLGKCHRTLGSVYAQIGDTPRSLAHYRKYLELEPNAPDVGRVRYIIEDAER